MPQIQATRLVDFAAIAGDWSFVAWSSGPGHDVALLFVDHPEDLDSELPDPGPVAHRIIHLPNGHAAGHICWFDLPPGEHRLRAAHRLHEGRWCIWYNRDVLFDSRPNGIVVDECGAVIDRFHVGNPWCAQTAEDGTIWMAYSDEAVSGGHPSGHRLVALDASGALHFGWRHDAMRSGVVYPIWSVLGLNVVSTSEVWVAFAEEVPLKTRGFDLENVLVRLKNGEVDRTWPWDIFSDSAPVRLPVHVAIAGGGLLMQGHGDFKWNRPAPDADRDRLYWMTTNSMRSMELIPVDEQGAFIGRFWETGRDSRLYLETERSLFVVDAAHLPPL